MKMDNTEIVEKIKRIQSDNECILVGIDGRGGAGKSTLANQLKSNLLNCQIIQMDDFYLPSDRRKNGDDFNFDWRRLEKEVLNPFSEKKEAKYQRYDWGKDTLAEWHNVQRGGVIIIEGCYSLRKELATYYDLKIWIEINKVVALKRGLKRDIEKEKPVDVKQKIYKWENDYQPLEDEYINTHNPKSYADIVIDVNNTDPVLTYL